MAKQVDPCTGPTIRAALAKLRAEFPDWTIAHIGGSLARWTATGVFDDPATLVVIESMTVAGLRARMVQNSWIVVPKYGR